MVFDIMGSDEREPASGGHRLSSECKSLPLKNLVRNFLASSAHGNTSVESFIRDILPSKGEGYLAVF